MRLMIQGLMAMMKKMAARHLESGDGSACSDGLRDARVSRLLHLAKPGRLGYPSAPFAWVDHPPSMPL
jgi:hypothetical protein